MTKQILHIEDDEDTAIAIKTMLELDGYNVESVRTGKEGITAAETGKYDLALIDIMLPDISGWEVYKHVPKQTNICFLSSLAIDKKLLRDLQKEGVKDYLTKPISKEQLLKAVSQMMK